MSDPNGGATKQPLAAHFLQTHLGKVLGGMALGTLLVGTAAYRFLEDWSWVDSHADTTRIPSHLRTPDRHLTCTETPTV